MCTGNICRSPIGERLTRAFAAETLGRHAALLTARSAGTNAVRDGAMDERSAAVLVGLGGDPTDFTGRQFAPEMAEQADLVLTLTRSHRRDVLKQAPRAMHRTFTVLEAADLFAQLPAGTDPPGRHASTTAAPPWSRRWPATGRSGASSTRAGTTSRTPSAAPARCTRPRAR